MAASAALSQPMVGGPTARLGRRFEHRQVAQEALAVGGQRIALERLARPIFRLAARHGALAQSEQSETIGQIARKASATSAGPAIFTIGAIITMRVNQQPRLVDALNSTVDAMEWASAK